MVVYRQGQAAVWVPVQTVAERLGVSVATVWRWTKELERGFPKPVSLSPGCTRWRLSDLEAWEAARSASAA